MSTDTEPLNGTEQHVNFSKPADFIPLVLSGEVAVPNYFGGETKLELGDLVVLEYYQDLPPGNGSEGGKCFRLKVLKLPIAE